jgi:hypothetical protein
MLNALLATALVFAAVGLLLYLLALLFNATRVAAARPLGGLVAGGFERWRVDRCIARSRRGDALREHGDLEGALHQYQAAFFLYPVRNRSLASTVANHHTGLLSRLIAVTEDLQGGTVRLLSLAKVDRLLSERSELQRRYLNSRSLPNRTRRREIDLQLEQNRRELNGALRQLIVEIRASRQPERMQ